MIDNEQYYPTPEDLAKRLVRLIKIGESPVLEPSAGTGALVEAFQTWHHSGHIHCIELNPERAATLKGKDFTVIWDDFTTFDALTPYSTIIMNPPFNDGARHLLKALRLCAPSGEIACVLNAETIKNPCTNERKALIAELEEQEKYTVDFVESAFIEAERQTTVEVALVYVKKKGAAATCSTLDHFKRWIADERAMAGYEDDMALTRYGDMYQLLDTYRAEIMAAFRLYDEIRGYNKVCLSDDSPYGSDSVFDIKVNTVGSKGSANRAAIVRKITYKYWKHLLYSKELDHLLTSEVQSEYSRKLVEMADFEFNERNILQLKQDLCQNLIQNLDRAILKVWEQFTSRYSYTKYSQNIHYYNGWKTNQAFRCNKKVIIPLYAFDRWDGKFEPRYSVARELSDIEKAMSYLDCGRTVGSDMCQRLSLAEQQGQSRGIDTKFFTVTCYKKGTCHLVFKDMELLKKFNLYCGRKKNWLPDDYGRKPYSHLDAEEKAVVDSFEGAESYEDTYQNQAFYLPQANDLLLLTAGKVA